MDRNRCPVADVFLPEEVLDEIMRGSHEDTVVLVSDAVEENPARFNKAEAATVMATFPGHVIVATNEGEFWRARFTINEGVVTFKSQERVKLPVVTRESVGEYARRQSARVVESLFDGSSPDDIRNQLRGLSEAATMTGVRLTPVTLNEAIKSRLEAEPAWLTALQEDSDILEDIEAETTIEPKFRAITDGHIGEDRHGDYRNIVKGSLVELAQRVDVLRSCTADMNLDEASPSGCSDINGALVAEEFQQFTALFVEDMDDLYQELRDAVAMFEENDLVQSCRIFDGVAERLPEYERGAAFIRKVYDSFENGDEA